MAEGLYYTQVDYVERFGLEEAIRITDESGAGEPDTTAFESAIADVSADMDAYLSSRYALPFDPVPRALKSIAAALVREKLHTQFPTDTVTREADLARKQLRDFATGLARLVVKTGEAPAPAPTGGDAIRVSAPARTFTADKLASY